MPTVSETLIKHRIKNVIRRFKFQELEDAVLPVFPETTWKRLRSQLDNNLKEKELERRLMRLELIDVSRHKRKFWYTYSISGSINEPPHIGTIDFKQTVKEKISRLKFTTKKLEVDAVVLNGIMYLSIKYVMQNNFKTPANYFAIFLGKKYIFSAQKKVLQGFVDAITQSMGYNKNKSLDLNGRNLMSLMRLLRIRKQGAVSLLDIMNKPMYKNAKPIIRKTGIDFTQERQRRKFLENRFGVDPPTLDTLVIKEANTSIYDREIASRLPNNTIKIGWQFRSENIAIFLINLFERGILLPPLPSYISNLMFMGRNTLTLEESQYCNN
ncbi:PREDICTED: uncharacterized protein LOC107072181 isoform X2 [Polistes dominula]|uniref:Uncharacterized protein LOC107072181 isoform X2 n=1 Tax=Polistes dominula TaxID=743375 RepID=A0ABM1J4M2_POLDO|nr:PREDICTED: uncharacterized protein LOC107072181 isoform X2 [Polistes dominula]